MRRRWTHTYLLAIWLLVSAAALLPIVASGQLRTTFTPEQQTVAVGGEVCIPVVIDNFDGILKMNLKVNFDPAVLSFVGLRNPTLLGLDQSTYTIPAPGEGSFRIEWDAPGFANRLGEDLPSGSTLMELCFRAEGDAGQISTVSFTNLFRFGNNNPDPVIFNERSSGRDIGLVTNSALIAIQSLPMELSLGSTHASQGEVACVPVFAQMGWFGVRSLRAEFVFSPSLLNFVEARNFHPNLNGFLGSGVALKAGTSNIIAVRDSITSGSAVVIPAGEKLFDLCFEMKSPCFDQPTHPYSTLGEIYVDFAEKASFGYRGAGVIQHSVRSLTRGQVAVERCDQAVMLSMGKEYGAVGDIVSIYSVVSGFHDITKFEAGFTFNPTEIRATGITLSPDAPSDLTLANFDLSQAASGRVVIDYTSATPKSMSDYSRLFAIDFELLGPINSIAYINPDTTTSIVAGLPGGPRKLIVERFGQSYQIGAAIALTSVPTNTFIGEAEVVVGNTVCIDITVDNFVKMTKYRQGFSWDASVLEFVSLNQLNLPVVPTGSCQSVVITDNAVVDGRGYFGIDWFQFSFVDPLNCTTTIPDGSSIMQLCFKVIGDGSACTAIRSDRFPYPPNDVNRYAYSSFVGTATVPIPLGGYVTDGFVCPTYQNAFTLSLPNNAQIGPTPSCFGVSVQNYNRIDAWRLSLGFDENLFNFVSIQPSLTFQALTVDQTAAANGRLGLEIQHKGPTSTVSTSTAFEMCFTAKPGPSACAPIDSILVPTRPYAFANRRERNLLVNAGSMCRVNPYAAITVNGTTVDVSCTGQTDGSITLATSGGTGNYVYAWTGSGTVATARDQSGLAQGTYSVTITDAEGWSAAVTRSFTVASRGLPPTANAGPDVDAPCNASGPVTLNGGASSSSAGTVYAWRGISGTAAVSAGGSSLNPTVSGEGKVELKVTSAGGCVALDTVDVTRRTSNVVTLDQTGDLTCDVVEVVLRGSVTPASARVTYRWTVVVGVLPSGPLDGSSLTVTQPGTYRLTALDADTGCEAFRDFVVGLRRPSIVAAIAVPDTLNCARATVTLRSQVTTAVTGLTYAWSTTDGRFVGASAQADAVVDRAGTYQLLVRDAATGCQDIVTVRVDSSFVRPLAVASRDTVLDCNSPSQTVTTKLPGSRSYAYLWSGPAGGLTSNPTLPSVVVENIGTYAVEITDVRNACVARDEVVITENFTKPIVEAGLDRLLGCDTTEVRLSGTASSNSGRHAMVWTTPNGSIRGLGDSSSVVATQAGVYRFTAIDSVSGCSATDSLRITQSLTAPQVSAGSDQRIDCVNPTATLTGSGSQGAGFGVSWTTTDGRLATGTQNQYTATALERGSYTLTITDLSTGCDATSSVRVTIDTLRPEVTLPDSVFGNCDRSAVSLMAGGPASTQGPAYSFTWRGPGGEVLVPGPTTSSTLEGRHQLSVRNTSTGCETILSTVVAFAERPVLAFSADTTTFICGRDSIGLRVAAVTTSSGQAISWTRNGAAATDLTSTGVGQYFVKSAGVYRLVLTASDGSCTTTSEPLTISDLRRVLPTDAGLDLQLTCRDSILTSTSPTPADPTWQYLWTGPVGANIDAPTSRLARFRSAGTYVLTITDPISKCTGTDELVVAPADRSGLSIALPQNFTLSCDQALPITPTTQVPQGPASYTWRSSARPGEVVSRLAQLDVSQPATYYLELTDEATGCTLVDSVVVDQATSFTIIPVVPIQLACDETSTSVSPTVDNPSNLPLAYQWTARGAGQVLSGQTDATAVLEAGVYEFRLREVGGTCETVAMVTVRGPGIPQVDAGADLTITCTDPVVTLLGTGSSGGEYAASWSTVDGEIAPGTDQQFRAVATGPGTYVLRVVNTNTLCERLDDVLVGIDTLRPVASLLDTITGNCEREPVSLAVGGPVFDDSTAYKIDWRDANGALVATSATATLTGAGAYTVRVVSLRNGCEQLLPTFVRFAARPPTTFIADTTSFICGRDSLALQVSAASLASGAIVSWTRDGLPATDLLVRPAGRYLAVTPGEYRLVLTAIDGSCTTTSAPATFVDLRRVLPADAGLDLQLTCRDTLLSSLAPPAADPTWRYEWTSAIGSQIEDPLDREAKFRTPGTYLLTVTDPATNCTGSDELQVLPANQSGLSITLPQNLVLSCDEQRTLVAIAEVPQGPASFAWRSSAQAGVVIGTASTLSVRQPATYYFTLTDESTGCTLVDSVRVDQAAPFVIQSVSPRQLACDETSASISPVIDNPSGLPLAYRWTAQTTGVILAGSSDPTAVLEAGRYEFRVSEVGGTCEAVATVTVLPRGIPLVEAGADQAITCASPTVSLAGSGSSGSNYSIRWSTADGALLAGTEDRLDAVATSSGNYQLRITNMATGCESSDVTTVVIDTLKPSAALPDTVLGNCDRSPVMVAVGGASFGDSLNHSFEWRNSAGEVVATSATALLPAAGPYLLQVRSLANGCDTQLATVVEFVERPEVSFSADTSTLICGRDSIALRLSPATIAAGQVVSWSLSGADSGAELPKPTADPAVYTANSKGVYTLILNTEDRSCVTFSARVELFDKRTRLSIDAGPDLRQTCRDSIVIAEVVNPADPAWLLQWTGPSGAPIGNPRAQQGTFRRPGTYLLTAIDPTTKCTGQDTIEVLPPDQRELSVNLPEDFTLGCGEERTLVADFNVPQGPATFRWFERDRDGDTLSALATLDVSSPGNYVVQVTDEATGCTVDDEITVAQVTAFSLGTVPDYAFTCLDTVVPISVAISNPSGLTISYQWTAREGGRIVGASNGPSARLTAGTFTLTATDTEGACSAQRTVNVLPYRGAVAEAIGTSDFEACDRVLTLRGNESDTTRGRWRLLEGVLEGFDPTLPQQSFLEPALGAYRLTYEIIPDVCPASAAVNVNFVIAPAPRVTVYDRVEEAFAKTRDTTIQLIPSSQTELVASLLSVDSAVVNINSANRLGIREWSANTLTVSYKACDRACPTRCDTANFLLVRGKADRVPNAPVLGFPNTITPNNDGLNETFVIEPLFEDPSRYPRARLTIVNRWGTVLFNAQPYTNNFAGISDNGSVIPDGTYYYVFMLDPLEGEVYKGPLTIIR